MLEVIVLLSLAGLVGSITISQARPTADLIRYRSTMQDLAAQVRAMPSRSENEGRQYLLRIDGPSGVLQVVTREVLPAPAERIDRTIWLPRGLAILEAPEELGVQSDGSLPSASILLDAPGVQRTFRLTTHPRSIVQLHEEPST